jgi:Tfp pilus assembly protein PilF
MPENHVQSRFAEVKDADALFKGTISLEHSGYWPLSNTEAGEKTLKLAPGELHPGLLEYMAACIPFRQVFTHGDRGIFAKAYTLVNKKEPSVVCPTEENKITPHPKLEKLLVANIHKTYDAEALERVLTACTEKNPKLVAYLFKGEKITPQLKDKHDIQQLEFTWPQFLEAREFYKYYHERLARLFKETRRWPGTIDFKNRQEFTILDKAVKRFHHINVYGRPGVGKTALLAKLADKISNNQTVVWVNIDSPNISKTEILIGMGLQLGLIDSTRILEHPEPTNLLRSLEKEIQRKIEAHDILVVLDSLDSIFNQGWTGIENKELQELFSGWVSEKLFGGGQLFDKSRLIFTGDIWVKETNDIYAPVKNSLSNVLKEKDQKIRVSELPEKDRKELLVRWLTSIEQGPRFQEEVQRLVHLAGANLRLLRLLALWACEAGSIAKISTQLMAVENANKWQRERLVLSHYFKEIHPQKKVILDTLEWIGKPVHRQVICSSPGMTETLEALIHEGLVIYNKEEDTCEPVYRFGRQKIKPGIEKEKERKKAFTNEILNFKRLGHITEPRISTAAGFFTSGNILCERIGNWDPWEDAPVIDAPGLLSRARVLLKRAKAIPRAKEKQKPAKMAVEYCEKSIQLGVQPDISHFICAQAMELAFPRSNEDKIENHYKKSIALKPYPDKLYSYARFIYRRLKDYQKAEITFKEAGILDKEKGKINIIGLQSFAEFYLSWPGHERQAGNWLNKIIGEEKNRLQNFSLAGRLYQRMGWQFLASFFYEAALHEDPKNIQVLNSYANACVEWKDKETARQLFEKALDIAPNDIKALNSYANACVEWKDKEKARQLFDKSLSIDPNHVPTLNSYANAWVEWKDKEKARQLFEKSLSIDSNNVPTFNSYANACVEWKDKETAGQLFEKALSLETDNIIVLNSYARACTAWGEADNASQLQKKQDALEKPQKVEIPSKIAAPAQTYSAPSPTTVTHPEPEPEPSPKLETPAPVSTGEEIPFSFTAEEKTWLITTTAKPLPLPGQSAQWAGFTMLYSLYYWESELDSLKELGIMPSFQREYDRLFNAANDLLNLVDNTSSQKPAREVDYQEEWFKKQGTPQDLIDYYDRQLAKYPRNPVCAAFICRSLETFSWAGTVKILKNQVPAWVSSHQKQWRQYMEKSGVDILTPEGKEKFRAFLEEQNREFTEQEKQSPGFTRQTAFDFINRFSNSWRDIPQYFPWHRFTTDQVSMMLGKLLELLQRLKNILADIQALKEEALKPLGEFIQDIIPLLKLMKHLSDYAYEQEKPEPIPLYVSGEINEITDTHLVVMVEHSGSDEQEWKIPRQDFPGKNPQIGQQFFAKIEKDQPDRLQDIEPLPVREESFEEILRSLFGDEAYEKISALWEKEEQ